LLLRCNGTEEKENIGKIPTIMKIINGDNTFRKDDRDFEASLGVLKLPDGSEHPITVAMGYSVLTHNMPHSMDDVVRAADAKMYEAKRRMKTENRS